MNQKKVVVITGAARGIGKAIAERFFESGFHLLLSDMDEKGLTVLKSDLENKNNRNQEVISFPGDLSEMSYIISIVEFCRKKWGRMDVLVNNAAWRLHNTMRTITSEVWEKTLSVCLTAPAFLTKYSAALMEEKKIEGTVINVSSIMSQRAGGTSPAYVAGKGALESLTYDMAALYGPSGIRILCVAPGNVISGTSQDFETPDGENISKKMEDNMNDQTPLMRSGQAREIANAVHWLSSAEASFITGTVVQVDGGFSHGFGHYSLKKLQFPDEF